MRNADRISFLIIAGICVYFWTESLSFTRFGYLFPRVIISILGFLALLLFVLSFFKTERVRIFEGNNISYPVIVLCILLVISWAFLIKLLGFVTTSVVFISVMSVILDKKNRSFRAITIKVVTTGVFVGAFYLFFSKLLLVSFPRGALF
jgi:hypothetical protein